MPKALLLMGLQNDILTKHNVDSSIINNINGCIKYAHTHGILSVLCLEIHHSKHMSFIEQGGNYPPHCIIGTWGKDIPGIIQVGLTCNMEQVVRGIYKEYDSNNAFYYAKSNGYEESSNLHALLRQHQVTDVYICGFHIDNAIIETYETSLKLGYNTHILRDCTQSLPSSITTCHSTYFRGVAVDDT